MAFVLTAAGLRLSSLPIAWLASPPPPASSRQPLPFQALHLLASWFLSPRTWMVAERRCPAPQVRPLPIPRPQPEPGPPRQPTPGLPLHSQPALVTHSQPFRTVLHPSASPCPWHMTSPDPEEKTKLSNGLCGNYQIVESRKWTNGVRTSFPSLCMF